MAILAAIFDLDGLMIRSEPLSHKAWRKFLHRYGETLTDSEYRPLIGMDRYASANYMQNQKGIPLSVEAINQAHWDELTAMIVDSIKPEPGLEALIESLTELGLSLGVASNSPARYVESALREIGLRPAFACVSTADQVAKGKPAPDVYIAAAQCLNVQPVNCLAIEDSPVGLKAALAAGMKCVVVPNRDLLEGDFEGAQAKFDSLRDLLDSHRQLLANWNLKGSSSQPAAP